MMIKLNWRIFFIEDDEFLEKYSVIVVKSVIVSRKTLIANPSTIKKFLITKVGSNSDETPIKVV